MGWWLLAPTMIAMLAGAGMMAVSRAYRVPRTPHRRDPQTLGIAFEEVRFSTVGQKMLYGWWIPGSDGAPTVILVHGWGRNLERVLSFVSGLRPAGFHLLAFDARSHGSSDIDGHATLLKFSEDVRAAVDFVVGRPEVDAERIGALGHSVGGSAAILAAGHDDRIRAVVSVGAFAHPRDITERDLRGRGVPSWLLPAIIAYVEHMVGVPFDEIAPETHIVSIPGPTLLIHGEQDEVIPTDQALRLAKAGGDNVDLLLLSGRGHSDCSHDPLFWPRVLEHFDQGL